MLFCPSHPSYAKTQISYGNMLRAWMKNEKRTWVRWVFLTHPTISNYYNGLSGLLQQHTVLQQAGAYCHGLRLLSCPGGLQNGQRNLFFILPCTQIWVKIQWSCRTSRPCVAEALLIVLKQRVCRSHHSYVFDTGFLPTAEDNDTYLVQYTPHHSYIPEDRLLHKHHHKVWLYPTYCILFTFLDAHEGLSAFHTQESHYLHWKSKINRILKKRSNQNQKALQPKHTLRRSDASQISTKAWNTELSQDYQIALILPNLPA